MHAHLPTFGLLLFTFDSSKSKLQRSMRPPMAATFGAGRPPPSLSILRASVESPRAPAEEAVEVCSPGEICSLTL